MKSRRLNRVTFFSKVDLSSGENLSKAEPILRRFNPNSRYEINDIIELYHIKLFIDNELFLVSWTKDDIKQFRETVSSAWNTIAHFWKGINDDNFQNYFDSLEFDYRPGFWTLIERLNVFKRISKEVFKEILDNDKVFEREVLRQKNLVNHFGQEIKEYLLEKSDSAELLLSQYEQHREDSNSDIYFPKCLSIKDKEQIIINYLNSKDANVNYVRLITKSKDTKLKLSPKTRLKAKKLASELNTRIFEEGSSVVFGSEVVLSLKQEEPYKESWEGNTHCISYSAKWLDELSKDLSLAPIFSRLFKYLEFGCISLISKFRELDAMETIGIRSKNEYVTSYKFTRKSNLSHLQFFLYSKYIEQKGGKMENILLSNVNDYLNRNLGLMNCRINFPSDGSSYLEKVRLLVPEIESLLKQYKLFVDEGEIDHELLQISSHSVSFDNIPSLLGRKYAYGTGEEYNRLAFWFFSDQSPLCYVEPYGSKYNNFYGLLFNEEVKISDFASYQKTIIDNLIQNGYLHVDADQCMRTKEETQIFIIGVLFLHETANYYHFSEDYRTVMNSMEKNGLLYFGKTLFSESERKYFNYYLNKSEFTNGLDLRNKYAHGTNTFKEDVQKNDYYILLKILVLILLKIEDDLLIFEYNNQIQD